MSYGLKYTIPFKTISEVSCVINIEVKDFVGTPTELDSRGNTDTNRHGHRRRFNSNKVVERNDRGVRF